MNEYYFVVFMYGASEKELKNGVINRHPLQWQKECNASYPGQYILKDWKQITREHYEENEEMHV